MNSKIIIFLNFEYKKIYIYDVVIYFKYVSKYINKKLK